MKLKMSALIKFFNQLILEAKNSIVDLDMDVTYTNLMVIIYIVRAQTHFYIFKYVNVCLNKKIVRILKKKKKPF